MLSGGGTATVSVDYYELGKQTGAMAAQILKGEAEPATMAIEMPANNTTEINQEEVDLLGITVPDELAEFVGDYAAEE